MKNAIKIFGIIAIIAVIGFAMIGCDLGSGDDGSSTTGGNNNGNGNDNDNNNGNGNGSSNVLDFIYEETYYNTIYITGYTGQGSSVTIPAQINGKPVSIIAGGTFKDCINLTVINVDTASTYFSSMDGVLYNKAQTRLERYPIGRTGTFTIPVGVTSIGSWAFDGCTGLTGITIPSSVTSVDGFGGCTGLTTVNIPSGVTSIASIAFEGCANLASVTIPGSVTRIGGYAFYKCDNLNRITFGAGSAITDDNFGFLGGSNIGLGILGFGRYLYTGTGTYTRSGNGTIASPWVWRKS
ncbi:MAG: leucine-rich repeat domain-containing protein [Treponema sp.]|jgi:hypothetical protein|nr:leucine-rich repeat domain-containing protein [Treponema sp.]